MNKRSKLVVCGIAVIAVLCMALPVLFHGTSNECKITGVSAADSRNHSVDTYTVEQDKKKCSVSFSDTAVIDTAFTAEVPTDEPYIIELTVRDSQLPVLRIHDPFHYRIVCVIFCRRLCCIHCHILIFNFPVFRQL